MKKMNVAEMQNTNGGEVVALLAIWGCICAGFCWVMGKLGDYGLKSVKRK